MAARKAVPPPAPAPKPARRRKRADDPPFDGGVPMKPAESAPPPKPEKSFKFPKTLGGCADRLFELKAKQALAQRVVDELDSERKALTEHVINTLPKSEATGVAGKVARVKVVTKEIPQVRDWPAFYAYARKINRLDLMQRRLNEAGVKELLEAKKKVAGVEIFTAVSISLTKV